MASYKRRDSVIDEGYRAIDVVVEFRAEKRDTVKQLGNYKKEYSDEDYEREKIREDKRDYPTQRPVAHILEKLVFASFQDRIQKIRY